MQLSNKTILNRLQQAVQSCDYKKDVSKDENVMLLQEPLLRIRENKTRERFLTAEDGFSFDYASRIARSHKTVARGLPPLISAAKSPSMHPGQHILTRGDFVPATVTEISTLHPHNADSPSAILARKEATLRRCVSPRKNTIRRQPESM